MTALRVRLWFWQLITRLSYFSQVFFYQIKNFLFLLWVNLYMITAIYLHDPPTLNGPFFITPPFSASQKVETLPLFPHPSPLLISDKSLAYFEPTGSCFPNLICSRIVCVCNELSVHKYSKNFSSPCFKMPSRLFRTSRPFYSCVLSALVFE